jgi:hypothetical protein
MIIVSREYQSAQTPMAAATNAGSGPEPRAEQTVTVVTHRQTVVSSKAGHRTTFLPEPGPRGVILTPASGIVKCLQLINDNACRPLPEVGFAPWGVRSQLWRDPQPALPSRGRPCMTQGTGRSSPKCRSGHAHGSPSVECSGRGSAKAVARNQPGGTHRCDSACKALSFL